MLENHDKKSHKNIQSVSGSLKKGSKKTAMPGCLQQNPSYVINVKVNQQETKTKNNKREAEAEKPSKKLLC